MKNLQIEPFSNSLWVSLQPSFVKYQLKSGDPTTLEHYYCCLASQSKCLVSEGADFLIFTIYPDYIWIDAFYVEGGNAYERYLDYFRVLADSLNKKVIKWTSRRKAYSRGLRVMEQVGQYKVDSIIYTMEL